MGFGFKTWLEEHGFDEIHQAYKKALSVVLPSTATPSDPIQDYQSRNLGTEKRGVKSKGSQALLKDLSRSGIFDTLTQSGDPHRERVVQTQTYLQHKPQNGTLGEILVMLFGKDHKKYSNPQPSSSQGDTLAPQGGSDNLNNQTSQSLSQSLKKPQKPRRDIPTPNPMGIPNLPQMPSTGGIEALGGNIGNLPNPFGM